MKLFCTLLLSFLGYGLYAQQMVQTLQVPGTKQVYADTCRSICCFAQWKNCKTCWQIPADYT